MRIYSIGIRELEDYEIKYIDPEKYEWVVYWYELDGYEESGQLVALNKDGYLSCTSLGHCSCYGPIDGELEKCSSKMSVEEFVKGPDNHIDDDYAKVKTKVLELLGKSQYE